MKVRWPRSRPWRVLLALAPGAAVIGLVAAVPTYNYVQHDPRFCMSCGQPVAAAGPVDEEARARLAAAAPSPLRQKMRAAKLTGGKVILRVAPRSS